MSAPHTPTRLGGGEPAAPSTGGAVNRGSGPSTVFPGGNPFNAPWRQGGRNVVRPLSTRLVDANNDAVAYVRPEVEELVRLAPTLLAAAELAIDTGAMDGLISVVALIHAERRL
ncbi:MAG: hypothetical protein AB7I04_18365 [Pseudomonadales bacterium]